MRTQEKLFKSIIKEYEDQNIIVGRTLHEYIAQDLYAIRMTLQRYSIENGHSLPIDQVMVILDGTLDKVKKVANDLLPVVLRDFGFHHAVNDLISQYNALKNNITIDNEIADFEYSAQLRLFQLLQFIRKATFLEDDSFILEVRLNISKDNILLKMEGVNESYINKLKSENIERIKRLQDRVSLCPGKLYINTNFNKNRIEVIVKLN